MASLVPTKMIGGGMLKLEQVHVICPACGEQLEAVARDGQVKGYCAVVNQHVDFPVETLRAGIGKHPTAETRAKLSAAAKKHWQDPDYRDKQIASHSGKHPTDETRAKLSAAVTRRHNKKGGR